MAERTCLAVVLAAGEGTRMRSSMPKVLHGIGGESMLAHVLRAVAQAGAADCVVVIGPDHDAVAKEAGRAFPRAEIATQTQRLGTAHAVLAARSVLERGFDDILVVFADTPLVRAETLRRLRTALAEGFAVAVAGFTPADPAGYGRLIVRNGRLVAIREHNDADDSERAVRLCNGGLMALDGHRALALLDRIGNANAKKEFYLTDAVALAGDLGLRAVAIEVNPECASQKTGNWPKSSCTAAARHQRAPRSDAASCARATSSAARICESSSRARTCPRRTALPSST